MVKIKWLQTKDEIKNPEMAALRKLSGWLQQMTSSIYTNEFWQKKPKTLKPNIIIGYMGRNTQQELHMQGSPYF